MSPNFVPIEYDAKGKPIRFVISSRFFKFDTYKDAVRAANLIGGEKYDKAPFQQSLSFESSEKDLPKIMAQMFHLSFPQQNPTPRRKWGKSTPPPAREIFDKWYADIQSEQEALSRTPEGKAATKARNDAVLKRLREKRLLEESIMKNPAPRIGTKKPNRRSQATGARPSKRLVARRKANAYEGFFPNPTPDVDYDAARELRLFIESDGDLYRQQFMPIIENIKRKMKSGKYDAALAPKLWGYLVDAGAKKYNKEYGDGTLSLKMFNKATRNHLAHDLSGHYQEAIENGEYGEIAYKKNPTVRKATGWTKAKPVKRAALGKFYLSVQNMKNNGWVKFALPSKTLVAAKKRAKELADTLHCPVKIEKE